MNTSVADNANPTPEIELTEDALNRAANEAIAAFEAAPDLAALEDAHRLHLGEKAPIPQARRALGTLPKDQRKDAGPPVRGTAAAFHIG